MNGRSPGLAGIAVGSIALLLAACSSSSNPTASPSPNPIGSGAAQASTALPSAGSAQGAPGLPSFALPSGSFALPSGSFAIPSGSIAIPSFSFPSEDKDLEARLPNAINGVTLTKYSWKGADFFAADNASSQHLQDLLNALGKAPADLSIAFASDPTGRLGVTVGAFKVTGADGNALLAEFLNAARRDAPSVTFTQASVGGRNVTQITDPTDMAKATVYAFTAGDVLFDVQSTDQALAAAALQAIP
jgi:hypothetical protein